jgi:hypothetical protein
MKVIHGKMQTFGIQIPTIISVTDYLLERKEAPCNAFDVIASILTSSNLYENQE